jgi:hypothetical protein
MMVTILIASTAWGYVAPAVKTLSVGQKYPICSPMELT